MSSPWLGRSTSEDEDDLTAGLSELDIEPPVLRHMPAATHARALFEEDNDEDCASPRYRGMSDYLCSEGIGQHDAVVDEDPVVYRSFGSAFAAADELWLEPGAAARKQAAQSLSAPSYVFELLPPDLVQAVFALLPSSPHLFAASRVSRAWRDAAMTSYAQRVVIVPTTAGALFQAAAQAEPGATLRLVPGMHHLSSELTVDRPLRILSDRETERVLGTWAAPSACAARRQRRGDDVVAAGASDSDEAVIVLMASGVVRTLCSTLISDVTLCRMGDPPVRYPNAVACAETGCLRMERCRVTCGGHATSVPEALQIFADAPAPGDVWSAPPGRPGGGDGDGSVSAGADAHGTPQPQAGVWVGAAASVELHGCMIVSCPGPGVKVYRGRLLAQGNTIAFSSSANVVVNGGHVVLEGNEIRGARGDGVASYNACQIRMHHNTVHSNRGYGVKLNLVAAQSSRMDPVLNPQTAHELQELNSVWHNAEGQVYGRPPH